MQVDRAAVRQRLEDYAQHISGKGEREAEYERQRDQLVAYQDTMTERDKAILKRQVRHLWDTSTRTYIHPMEQRNYHGMRDNGYQDLGKIADFEYVKLLIRWLDDPNTDPLDVSDRFEAWRRRRQRRTNPFGKRKSKYEEAFNNAYYSSRLK